jgi:hypothetical protein
MRKTYLVIVDHAYVPTLRDQHIFACNQDRYDGTWYATAEHFGCSKNYRTPEDAIYGVVSDHAGTVLSITERN